LSRLGADSVESVEKRLEATKTYEKQIKELQNEIVKAETLKQKVEVMQSGIDDKFIDFVIHELQTKATENEDFSESLNKFKENNPQYLKTTTQGVKFNTASSFEGTKTRQNANEIINHLIRGGT